MTIQRIPFAADDGHVTLSPDDAQALADATMALQRANIERLLAEETVAKLTSMERGQWKEFQRARRSLRHAQDAALRAFAHSRGMRPISILGSSFNWDLLSLRDDDYSRNWCELCGTGCQRGYRESEHGNSFNHKDGLAKIVGKRKLHAILAHTRHSFEKVAAFATDVRLNVEHIGYSWHGADYIAVLFTRGAK
jgi:hypothetical protein